ncbi:MAG: DUF3185 domain-containing protein [Gemmatimonadetes bacterium]|nr:MAG: DUF3185 domain-containing protein [Gemmatimonadota bacterium]
MQRLVVAHWRAANILVEVSTMKVGTLVGIILVVLGLVGIAYGGISYSQRREVARVGPLQVTTREERTIPISPIVGGVAILAGVALIVAVRRAS